MVKTTQRVSANPTRDLPTNPDALLTRPEAAQLLGVTEHWVLRAHRLGELPYVRVGKLVRWRLGDLLAFIEDRRVPARDEAK